MEEQRITNDSKGLSPDPSAPERIPGSDEQPHTPSTNYNERKKELNSKILEITMKIREDHPELIKYLDEVPETIPNEKDPEMVLMDLKHYYDSLCSILTKYHEEHK